MKKFILAAGLTTATFALNTGSNYCNRGGLCYRYRGRHAFVDFKIKHLGYSWLLGRFNTFDGDFSYDAKAPNESAIQLVIDVASIDSNHAERDKHLKGADFLDVKKFPKPVSKAPVLNLATITMPLSLVTSPCAVSPTALVSRCKKLAKAKIHGAATARF